MNPELELTDDAIREVFERRAARATPGNVREMILARTVAMAPARPSWSDRLRESLGYATPARAVALVILAAMILVIGVAVVGSRPVAPEPTPVATEPTPPLAPHETAAFFVRRFEYQIPAASELKNSIEPSPAMLSFTAGGGDAYGRDADGNAIPGARGITFSSTHLAVTHSCPSIDGGSGRVPVREDPAGFLEDLREIGGAGIGQPATGTFDGRPALSATVDPRKSACDFSDFHVEGGGLGFGYVLLTVPSRLIVTEVDGMTIVLQVWAGTETDLQVWLPTATEFLDSVHFAQQP